MARARERTCPSLSVFWKVRHSELHINSPMVRWSLHVWISETRTTVIWRIWKYVHAKFHDSTMNSFGMESILFFDFERSKYCENCIPENKIQ
jgi:hypothetical protein